MGVSHAAIAFILFFVIISFISRAPPPPLTLLPILNCQSHLSARMSIILLHYKFKIWEMYYCLIVLCFILIQILCVFYTFIVCQHNIQQRRHSKSPQSPVEIIANSEKKLVYRGYIYRHKQNMHGIYDFYCSWKGIRSGFVLYLYYSLVYKTDFDTYSLSENLD